MLQVFLIGPLLDLQPDKPALRAVSQIHQRFKGDFAFATAAVGTDPAEMLMDFFGLRKGSGIQVQHSCGVAISRNKLNGGLSLLYSNPTWLVAVWLVVLRHKAPI